MQSTHLILGRPLLLLPPISPSIRVFSNDSTLRMRWPKYWSFSFSIIPSKEIPGLISFRMDWLDLLAVQGTLKSLLQHHSLNASILRHSAFCTVQLSHPYMTTRKTIALTRRTSGSLKYNAMPLTPNLSHWFNAVSFFFSLAFFRGLSLPASSSQAAFKNNGKVPEETFRYHYPEAQNNQGETTGLQTPARYFF